MCACIRDADCVPFWLTREIGVQSLIRPRTEYFRPIETIGDRHEILMATNFPKSDFGRLTSFRVGEPVGADESGANVAQWPPEAVRPADSEPDAEPLRERSEALAEIARNHHAALVRFLALRTGSTEDAKEIVQEAYAKVLALDRPGTISLLAGYLWRVAANLAIDRGRQRVARGQAQVALPALGDATPSTESVVELRERLAIVERAISELPPRCHQAFLLRIVEGQRFAQVGRQMGITERMAKLHVARAMEYLQLCVTAAETPGKLT